MKMKTYWVFDRIHCVWKKVTTSYAVWAATPKALAVGGCSVAAAGLLGGGLLLAPKPPIHDDLHPGSNATPPEISGDYGPGPLTMPSPPYVAYGPAPIPYYPPFIYNPEPGCIDCGPDKPTKPGKPHAVYEPSSAAVLFAALSTLLIIRKKRNV